MVRPPPRSTLDGTLLPYTTLFRSRAMKQIGILPSMRRVFSLGFLGDASSRKRSEAHTSELQSHHPNSYAVVCLKKKKETEQSKSLWYVRTGNHNEHHHESA